MNFLDLLNMVARTAKPAYQDLKHIDNMETLFKETDIDSLDGMMIVMYICIIYDIPDDVGKDFTPTTPQELYDFVQQHKQRDPESIEAAQEMIK